jgi:hypothetical protein
MLGFIILAFFVISFWSVYYLIKFTVEKSEERSINFLEQNSRNINEFDFIIIFGAARNNDEPSNELRARIDFALQIWRNNKNSKFVITGGVNEPNNEQAVICDYLIKNSVPLESLYRLENSNTTRNTIKSLFLQNEEFQDFKILAVTSSYHAKRIEIESKRNNVLISVSAPRLSPEVQNVRVHKIRITVEIFAILFYMLPTRLTRNIKTGHGTFRHAIPKFFIKVISSRTQPSI